MTAASLTQPSLARSTRAAPRARTRASGFIGLATLLGLVIVGTSAAHAASPARAQFGAA